MGDRFGAPFRHGLFATAAVAAIAAASPAMAQTRSFNVPEQSAARGIPMFARQARIQLLASGNAVRGRRTNAVRGTLTVEEGLRQLLAGTGLEAGRDSGGTGIVTIRATGAAGQTAPGEGEAGSAAADSESAAILITGTRISGVTPTSPVVSVDRTEIERGGYTTLQDLMARVPQNFSGVTPATGTASGNVGLTTQLDIRGLGPQATLTLVNGRRTAGAAGNSGRAFDISMIPVAAIERVDILTDGASALYGSDAVGGVVNLVLRRDFEGAETSVQYGLGRGDRENLLVSQLVGLNWSGGHMLAAFQYDRKDAVTSADLGIDSLDFRPRGGGDFRTRNLGSPGTVVPAGFFQGQPFATLFGPGGSPVFSAMLPAGAGRDVQLSHLGLNQQSVFDPVPVDVVPSQRNISGYLTIEQEIGPITLFGDGVYARRRGRQRIIPQATFLFVPPTNAFSPFNEPVLVGYALTEFGPITASPESEGWFVNLGARGGFGGGWTWELVGSASEDEFRTEVTSINVAELNRRLALADPAQAFNPFGDGSGQSPGVVDAIRTQSAFSGVSNMRSISGQTSGQLTEFPAGALRLVLGGEYREEDVATQAQQTGGAPTFLFPAADRNLQALFAEAYLPLFSSRNARPGFAELALSAAGRWEHYSDFGDTFNPKLGILWRPASDVVLRASWGTSFRAPGLRELFALTRISPNFSVLDPRAPGGPRTVFVDFVFGGNPDLQPEKAETYTISAAYRPAWLEGARIEASYFHTEYRDRIRGSGDGLSAPFLLSIENQLPPGIIVRRPDGSLQTLNLVNINTARTTISGIDVEAGYRWSGPAGEFNLSALATHFFKFDEQLINGAPILGLAGQVANPADWRARGSLSWTRGVLGASVSVNHTAGLDNLSPDPRIVRREVSSQTTVDVQLSLIPQVQAGPLSGLSLRLGATNLFDARPPFVDGASGYDPRNHVLEGRTVYLRVTTSFGGGR